MKLHKGALFSLGEENTFRILDEYFRDSAFVIYKEVALSRVVDASRQELSPREWSYYRQASLDFVICPAHPPHPWELAIEFDSAYHDNAEQKARDDLKNTICVGAGLPLIRIRSDHVLKRDGTPFLKYMLDLYFGEKAVQERVEQGALSPEEEFFPGTEFDGTTKLRKQLEASGIFLPIPALWGQVRNPNEWRWYRVGVGSDAVRQEDHPGWTIGSASVEILQGLYNPQVILSVERRAYLKECSPLYNVPGVHGWFIANEFARFLCFQEVIRKLDVLLSPR